MITWQRVLEFANQGNPAADRKVVRSDAEWRELL
ncbi:MAG: peptide-methionine (R)-S-oxide reductase, partial [Candidatus Thiodiazotropha taylori]|nr:peptide-methionine (R)-S-oxide reductase [Candidatus Thiodiazotropha taylori]MCW4291142.1 peptide-methionine (R)-S-oxide reductase [Candidatus Thiodiazotropha taylori]